MDQQKIAENIHRFRSDANGSALNRYGFIREPEGDTAGTCDLAALLPGFAATGGDVAFDAVKDEDWIGFGDVVRDRMFHRGHSVDCWVRNVKSYVTSPFFISTRGHAVLVNSTHRVQFDLCAATPDKVTWKDHAGRLDFYVFTGGSFLENIRLYTWLTGKPQLPPAWSFGLWYICRMQANDYEAVNDAVNFRREGIPCDVIGLEPGWMEEKDDLLSTDKKWHPQRFPTQPWCPNGPHNFIDAIKRMGFHFELWERNEYDLSYEEERRLGGTVGANADEQGNFKEGAEADTHFSWPRLPDNITKKDEPWFEHHKKFIDQGADFFKQDGSYQICEHPGRVWGNGMLDAEMHNLYPLLYSRQMWEGFRDNAKRRPVIFTPSGWTGFQAFSGTWTGDVGGRLETLGSMLNTAVFAHNWCTNDMEVMQPEGIHFGYLQPWSQINSWTYFRMPWVQGERLLGMHKSYSRLRSQLLPYIYSWAARSAELGLPLLMRPLQLEFEADPQCRGVMHEYLLGRDLLVSVYKPEVYLPAGSWVDFWTGKVYAGGKTHNIVWPEGKGGGLFLREGAIIPFGPVTQYRGEKPLDAVELHVFPKEGESVFELYEDDGVSFDHVAGKRAVTRISCRKTGAAVSLQIAAPEGAFVPCQRTWSCLLTLPSRPKSVKPGWSWDEARSELTVPSIVGSLEL